MRRLQPHPAHTARGHDDGANQRPGRKPSPAAIPSIERRTFLKGAAIAGLAPGLLVTPAAAHRERDDWDHVAHDLSATRRARQSPSGLSELWRQPLAGGVTGPALVFGHTVVAASFGGEVARFDLADGQERWRRAFEPAEYGGGAVSLGFFGGCAVAGDRIFVASDRVRCLSLWDGSTVWEADPLPPPGGDDYFWGAPVVAGGLVIAGSGAGSEATETRGRVSAYRIWDGALKWSAPMVPEGGNGGGVLSPVSVDPDRRAVFAGTGSPYVTQPGPNPGTNSIVELDLRDGAIRGSDQIHPADDLGLDINSAPVLGPRVIAVTSKDGVWAWHRYSRERLWHTMLTPATPAGGGPASAVNGPEGGPIATDGYSFYVLSNDGDNGFAVAAALNARSGEVRWQRQLGGLAFAAPALAGRYMCASTLSGELEVMNASDGELVGTVALGGPSAGAVSAARGRLLVGIGAGPFLPGGELICVG